MLNRRLDINLFYVHTYVSWFANKVRWITRAHTIGLINHCRWCSEIFRITFFTSETIFFSPREHVYWHFEADMDRRVQTNHRTRIIVSQLMWRLMDEFRKTKHRTANKSKLSPTSFHELKDIDADQSKFQ